MAGDAEMQQINRTLKEISHSLKTQNRILEVINFNLTELVERLPKQPEETDD